MMRHGGMGILGSAVGKNYVDAMTVERSPREVTVLLVDRIANEPALVQVAS